MGRSAISDTDFRRLGLAGGAYTTQKAVTYSGSLKFDVWKPVASGRPIIAMFHGGSWGYEFGARDSFYMNETAARFADLGFCVFSVSYTLQPPAPQDPITDVLTFMTWVRSNAATYNGDSTKVATIGISAGAHITAMAAIQGTAGSTRPDAVVCWSLPANLPAFMTDPGGTDTGQLEDYLGDTYVNDPDLWVQFSPTLQLSSVICPFRIVGGDDETLPRAQFDGFVQTALALGYTEETCAKRIWDSTVHGLYGAQWYYGNVDDVNGTAAWLYRNMPWTWTAPTRSTASRTTASGRTLATGTSTDAPPDTDGSNPGLGPFEPAGYTQDFDVSWNSVTQSGWSNENTAEGFILPVTTPEAPGSPPNALGIRYRTTMAVGTAAYRSERALPANKTGIYQRHVIGVSANFYGHDASAVNKLVFTSIHDAPCVYMQIYGAGTDDLHLRISLQGTAESPDGARELVANQGPLHTGIFARGIWHDIEHLMISNTPGVADGIVRVWQNGILIIEYTDVKFSGALDGNVWQLVTINPTYGGTGGSPPPATQYVFFDHSYCSVKA